jgi:hypothetical protein
LPDSQAEQAPFSTPGREALVRQRITKRLVDALGPDSRDVFVWDKDLTGFGVKVTPAGSKVYLLQYRTRTQTWKSAPKRVTIGKHGDLTPDQARRMAADLLLEVKTGGDPRTHWEATEAPTVAELVDRFLKEYLPGKKKPPRAKTVADGGVLRARYVPGAEEACPPAAGDTSRRPSAGRLGGVSRRAGRREEPDTLRLPPPAVALALRRGAVVAEDPQHTNPAKHIERYPEPEQRRGGRKASRVRHEPLLGNYAICHSPPRDWPISCVDLPQAPVWPARARVRLKASSSTRSPR